MLRREFVRAHRRQVGENDCGPACAQMLLQRHGVAVDGALLRESAGLDQNGTSLLHLQDLLAGYGIDSDLYLLSADELAEAVCLAGPAIALVADEDRRHLVVIHAASEAGDLVVGDPSLYRPYQCTAAEFALAFTGHVLVTGCPAPVRRSPASLGASRTNLADALRIVGQVWRPVALAVALSVMVSLLALSSTVFIQSAIDRVALGAADVVGVLAGAFALVYVAAGALRYAQGRLVIWLVRRSQRELTRSFVTRLLSVPTGFLRRRRIGDLVSRIGDIEQIQALFSVVVLGAVVNGVFALAAGAYIFSISRLLFAVLLIPVALSTMCAFFLNRSIREASQEALQRDASLRAEVTNLLHGYEDLVALGKRGYGARRVEGLLERKLAAEARLGRVENLGQVVRFVIHGVSIVLLGWIGVTLVMAGKASIGEVFAVYSLAGYILAGVTFAASLQVTCQRALAAVGRYQDVMNQQVDPATVAGAIAGAGAHQNNAAAQRPGEGLSARLSYTYPLSVTPTIDDLELQVAPPDTCLLTGANGSGKSTALRALAGIDGGYDGHVTLDGTDIRAIPEQELRSRVLYLAENPLTVTGTVRENLTLGDDHQDARIWQACRMAAFDQVVTYLPGGLDHHLREGGAGLSRGESQRLGLARAILRDPEVFLFDEAFSAVDSDAFAQIWANLDHLPAARILVSHTAGRYADVDTHVGLAPKGRADDTA